MKKNIVISIISFLLGALIFGFVGVYAGNTINSNEVLYDNSESGLTSDTMQGAVNELYDKANYGDAEAAQILSGITALVGGKKVTGSIPSKASGTYYATTSDQTISSGQYLSGAQTIKGLSSTNYSAGNIKAGTTISVSNGNANVYSVAGTFTSDGTATAAQILKDKIAYVNGNKLTGTMANNGATGGTINPGGSYTIPAGYTSGGTVKANANQNSGTYTPTSRSASLDMGVNNTYRYVNTNSVPNTNSGTYTYAANSTGGTVDLGAANTYRYVNAANVYAKGKSDGASGKITVKTGSFTPSTSSEKVIDCGFKPKYLLIHNGTASNLANAAMWIYNSSYSTTAFYSGVTDTYNGPKVHLLANYSTSTDFIDITSTGFKFSKCGSAVSSYTLYYVALG